MTASTELRNAIEQLIAHESIVTGATRDRYVRQAREAIDAFVQSTAPARDPVVQAESSEPIGHFGTTFVCRGGRQPQAAHVCISPDCSPSCQDCSEAVPQHDDALDGPRYRAWRDGMLSDNTELAERMAAALPLEVGTTRSPTAAEWDAAVDAAITALPSAAKGSE